MMPDLSMKICKKSLEIFKAVRYTPYNRAATPLAVRPSAFWAAICFNGVRGLELSSSVCYTISNTPATPLAARLSATRRVVSYNSTRHASGRKAMLKSAGLLFLWQSVVEFPGFVYYNIANTPATPLSLAANAHFRQAFSFLGFPYGIWKAHFI